MKETGSISTPYYYLITAASFVILVAGMRAAASILVPFLLSIFLAIICTPLLFWMRKKGVPNALAVLTVLVVLAAIGVLLVVVVSSSLNSFLTTLPAYQKELTEKTAALVSWLHKKGIDVSNKVLIDYLDPGKIMRMVANTFTTLSAALKNVVLILLTVVFILLEAAGFHQKLAAALPQPQNSLQRLSTFTESVNRYLALKTLFSVVTAVAIWIWLTIVGVDYALLWALLAFLLNYVPTIGSMIAAVPAILLAVVQLGGSAALLTAAGYAVVNVSIGSVIEPRFMGRGLGLSTLVVFLSLVFWGWVLGPVGMLLSVPLTMIVKIALESNEDTRWLAMILGPAPSERLAASREKRATAHEKDVHSSKTAELDSTT
ncbi:MAG: AI-2E family transporter [Deltaproteobacteria bacterium]|nr:AI-2E family transporter [Deltaproteobacteria bacterium]